MIYLQYFLITNFFLPNLSYRAETGDYLFILTGITFAKQKFYKRNRHQNLFYQNLSKIVFGCRLIYILKD